MCQSAQYHKWNAQQLAPLFRDTICWFFCKIRSTTTACGITVRRRCSSDRAIVLTEHREAQTRLGWRRSSITFVTMQLFENKIANPQKWWTSQDVFADFGQEGMRTNHNQSHTNTALAYDTDDTDDYLLSRTCVSSLYNFMILSPPSSKWTSPSSRFFLRIF